MFKITWTESSEPIIYADIYFRDDKHIYFEDFAENILRLNIEDNSVEILNENNHKWTLHCDKVYEWEHLI